MDNIVEIFENGDKLLIVYKLGIYPQILTCSHSIIDNDMINHKLIYNKYTNNHILLNDKIKILLTFAQYVNYTFIDNAIPLNLIISKSGDLQFNNSDINNLFIINNELIYNISVIQSMFYIEKDKYIEHNPTYKDIYPIKTMGRSDNGFMIVKIPENINK